MSKIQRITPDCQPVFPCWLWNRHLDEWTRYASTNNAVLLNPVGWDEGDYTHFHPDQPTAPTERPDGLPPGLAEYNHRLETSQETPADIMAQHGLPPEVQAACEHLDTCASMLELGSVHFKENAPLATHIRTLLAWVEGQRPEEPTISGQVAERGVAPEVSIKGTEKGDAGSTPALSTPSPASQPLALALEAAAREINDRTPLNETRLDYTSHVAAILHRHAAPEFERVQREGDQLNEIITGVFPATAALHEILRRAGCVSVSQADYDELQRLRALRSAADDDRERLDTLALLLVTQYAVSLYADPKAGTVQLYAGGPQIACENNLRAAIDTARASERRENA